MNAYKLVLMLAAVAGLGGCAVYPAGYYGSPRGAYYQPAPYYGPSVGIGVYGGRGYHGYR